MTEAILLAGTRKGLFIGRSDGDRESWTWDKPLFPMEEVYSASIDARGGAERLLAGGASPPGGPRVFRSEDLGRPGGGAGCACGVFPARRPNGGRRVCAALGRTGWAEQGSNLRPWD